MEQRLIQKHAARKGVLTKFGKEESASGMVQRSQYAAMKDAPTKPRGEEFAKGTAQMTNKSSSGPPVGAVTNKLGSIIDL